jgi:hypothetical protein
MASLVAPISSTPCSLENALAGEIQRAVERGLPAHGRQQRIRLLHLDDALHRRHSMGSM